MDEIVQLSILNILNGYILERAELKRRLITEDRRLTDEQKLKPLRILTQARVQAYKTLTLIRQPTTETSQVEILKSTAVAFRQFLSVKHSGKEKTITPTLFEEKLNIAWELSYETLQARKELVKNPGPNYTEDVLRQTLHKLDKSKYPYYST
jgi:hypothetical protein